MADSGCGVMVRAGAVNLESQPLLGVYARIPASVKHMDTAAASSDKAALNVSKLLRYHRSFVVGYFAYYFCFITFPIPSSATTIIIRIILPRAKALPSARIRLDA